MEVFETRIPPKRESNGTSCLVLVTSLTLFHLDLISLRAMSHFLFGSRFHRLSSTLIFRRVSFEQDVSGKFMS